MQFKKTYQNVNPELLYDEVRDFFQKQGVIVDEARLETYSLPSDSSAHVVRGTLIFKTPGGAKCLQAHIVGQASSETKLMLDIDETLFPREKSAAAEADLDFIFGAYEVKPPAGDARR